MDVITYDLIIEYLCKESAKKFSINNDVKFDNILANNFFSYNILDSNDSIWISLLSLLKDDFIVSYQYNDTAIINDFKNDLLDKYSSTKIFYNKLLKNDYRELFKINSDTEILQYIVDILDINLFIFDYTKNEVSVLYNSSSLCINKDNYLIAKKETLWEPLMQSINNEINKKFNFNDQVIINILNDKDNLKYYKNIKSFSYYDLEFIKSLDKKKITKLKIQDIKNIISMCNINLKGKELKNELIDILIDYINKINVN